jgi:hypothetical protein
MTVEQLEEGYGHHHPDFQDDAASAFGGRRWPKVDEAAN